jgi:hypothetical protein
MEGGVFLFLWEWDERIMERKVSFVAHERGSVRGWME